MRTKFIAWYTQNMYTAAEICAKISMVLLIVLPTLLAILVVYTLVTTGGNN